MQKTERTPLGQSATILEIKKQLQWFQMAQSKSVAERSRRGPKPCGTGALEGVSVVCRIRKSCF